MCSLVSIPDSTYPSLWFPVGVRTRIPQGLHLFLSGSPLNTYICTAKALAQCQGAGQEAARAVVLNLWVAAPLRKLSDLFAGVT